MRPTDPFAAFEAFPYQVRLDGRHIGGSYRLSWEASQLAYALGFEGRGVLVQTPNFEQYCAAMQRAAEINKRRLVFPQKAALKPLERKPVGRAVEKPPQLASRRLRKNSVKD